MKPAPVPAVVPATAAPRVPPGNGEAGGVVLVWDGISPLHKSFFTDGPAVAQLGRDLVGSVEVPANVYVAFDSNRHIGRIHLRLLPGTGRGLSAAKNTSVDLNKISPILQALARYRSAVAARYDTRVEAFRIGLEAFRGPKHCLFGAAGTLPPDGTVIDPCVQINSQSFCGEASGELLVFEAEVASVIHDCLN